jgi:hypothetical protein
MKEREKLKCLSKWESKDGLLKYVTNDNSTGLHFMPLRTK